MEDTDADQRESSPFGDDLRPAIRRIGEERSENAIPVVSELTGQPQTLESTVQVMWILQAAVSAAILGSIVGIGVSLLSVGGPWIGGVVFSGGFLLGIIFAVLRYRIWSYQVRSDSLYLRRGVITKVTTVAPYVRIQHVDTRRGPLERSFGLATTVVYTAGSRGADVSIPGLTPERADDLQTRLKQLAIAAEGEDAV